jgi:hypothetical protein
MSGDSSLLVAGRRSLVGERLDAGKRKRSVRRMHELLSREQHNKKEAGLK